MSFISAREHGAKPGSGGVASAQQESIDRRERLRRLALETIDLAKDPYYMRNHIGQIECRLCLTLHPNEGNYLAHTQGKRHQQNLAKRAAREAAEKSAAASGPAGVRKAVAAKRSAVKIGRPGYRVTKQFDPVAGQRSLLFQVDYPEIEEGERPRHRFMSAYEQRVEAADKRWAYLCFAAEPYEIVAFKVPNAEVDKGSSSGGDDGGSGGGGGQRFFSHWDPDAKVYSLQVTFKNPNSALGGMDGGLPLPPPPPLPPGGVMRPPPPPLPPMPHGGPPPGLPPPPMMPPPRPPPGFGFPGPPPMPQ